MSGTGRKERRRQAYAIHVNGVPGLIMALAVIAGLLSPLTVASQQTVVVVELYAPGVEATSMEASCGNITVVEIVIESNTTMARLMIDAAQNTTMETLIVAYECAKGQPGMDVASLILEATIRASQQSLDEALASKTLPGEEMPAVTELHVQKPESADTADNESSSMGAIENAPGQLIYQAEDNASIDQPVMQVELEDNNANTGILIPIIVGLALGALFYYIARVV